MNSWFGLGYRELIHGTVFRPLWAIAVPVSALTAACNEQQGAHHKTTDRFHSLVHSGAKIRRSLGRAVNRRTLT